MRAIEDLKSWLESAMNDSMSRKTTMEFVARVVEDARDEEREACQGVAELETTAVRAMLMDRECRLDLIHAIFHREHARVEEMLAEHVAMKMRGYENG